MVADVTEWLDEFPTYPVVRRIEGSKQFTVEAVSLTSELPFKMIARQLFGDMLDDAVRLTVWRSCFLWLTKHIAV